MSKQYLYLASRSKQGIKLITVIEGNSIVSSKVKDLNSLGLPYEWQKKIYKISHENRMLYELRIESASSYQELCNRLKIKGFKNIPMGISSMLNSSGRDIPKANTKSLPVRSSMLRKRKK